MSPHTLRIWALGGSNLPVQRTASPRAVPNTEQMLHKDWLISEVMCERTDQSQNEGELQVFAVAEGPRATVSYVSPRYFK